MRKLAIAVALALGAASFGAGATTTDLGMVSPTTPTPFNGFVPPASIFTDVYKFELPANLGSGYSVVNFPLTIPGGNFSIIFSSMALFSNPDGILFNGDDTLLTTANGPGNLAFNWSPTAGGDMYLTVSGVSNGTLGGIYNGAISVTPIPEPGTWAMFATGGMLLGFALRRSRAK
jgi:hypothetical protein